ncbi:histidine kinase [Tychonema sp. LEGE 07203]|uniref:histidine kinase n=1 Tax=Tychonema sp. LEGE 07203 TaxID=1828671 RepID=UPI001881FEDC|nr:histidine kinase [Tychonema sp. LEGE 07203]MBE9092781.1 histidine kinase [Tychonema sp. LEGE 07203]
MYDMTRFTPQDMAKCSLVLRQLGRNTASMEACSQKIVKFIYQHFCTAETGENSCVLVRLFKTHPYGELEESLQQSVRRLMNNNSPASDMKCWTLLAAAGAEPQWNSRHTAAENTAIGLVSAELVAEMPAISEIIRQFGLDIPTVIGTQRERFLKLEPAVLNIFHVSEAKGSLLIPEQKSLIIPYQVKSVLGFGGLLPSGSLFAVVMFLKVKIPQNTAQMFKHLALSVKTALLLGEEKVVFDSSHSAEKVAVNNNFYENQFLEYQIANLIELLDFSEQEMLRQAARFQGTIDKLQREIADRKNKEQALPPSQEPFTGILNVPNEGIVRVEENQGSQRLSQGEEQI